MGRLHAAQHGFGSCFVKWGGVPRTYKVYSFMNPKCIRIDRSEKAERTRLRTA